MDARMLKTHAVQIAPELRGRLKPRLGGQRATKPAFAGWGMALVLALVLCIASIASAMPAHPFSPSPSPMGRGLGGGATASPSVTPLVTTTPIATATSVTQPTVTPATTSTPSEAQTPLHLSDPTSPDGGLTTGAPWWQSALDVTWKLVLVVGLILLAMRLLVALKQRGFTPKIRRGSKEKPEQRHFFEQIEEIVLAPQHVLHAVRAGDRIMLIARTQGALRALGEVDLSVEVDTVDAEVAGTTTTFADHLFHWAGLGPKVEAVEPPPAPAPPYEMPEPAAVTQRMPAPASVPRSMSELKPVPHHEEADQPLHAGVPEKTAPPWIALPPPIVAQAKVSPEVVPTPGRVPFAGLPSRQVSTSFATLPERRGPVLFAALPMRQGTASDSEAPPETLSASQEREILWYAETHNDTDTARKFGLTRQRVTAMRLRVEREEAQRLLEAQSHEREVSLADRPAAVAPVPALPRPASAARRTPPVAPNHPREEKGSEVRRPSPIPQGSAARAAYQQTPQPTASPAPTRAIKPDVATANPANDDAEPQAVTVGQILAARFGIKVPTTK